MPWKVETVLSRRKELVTLAVSEGVKPTFPISDCGCPKNPPSFATVMVGASTNAGNYPVGLTNPSLGAVN